MKIIRHWVVKFCQNYNFLSGTWFLMPFLKFALLCFNVFILSGGQNVFSVIFNVASCELFILCLSECEPTKPLAIFLFSYIYFARHVLEPRTHSTTSKYVRIRLYITQKTFGIWNLFFMQMYYYKSACKIPLEKCHTSCSSRYKKKRNKSTYKYNKTCYITQCYP